MGKAQLVLQHSSQNSLLFIILAEKEDEVKFSCKSGAPDEVDGPESRGITLTPDEMIKDKISYKVATKKGIEVKVDYKEEYLDDETDDFDNDYEEIKTTFEVKFDRIIEYAKGDSENGGDRSLQQQAYDWDNDIEVQSLDLSEWNDFSTVMSDEEGVVSHFNTSTIDGIVAFKFTVSRATMGGKASANSMKIDVNITDFPWMREDTYLALMSSVKSKLKVYMDYDETALAEGRRDKQTQEVQVSFEQATGDIGFVPFGEYTWEDTAEATSAQNETDYTLDAGSAQDNTGSVVVARNTDGSESSNATKSKDTVSVIGTSPEQLGNETYQLIAYSFVGEAAQGASEIYWDPETGIGYSGAAYGFGFAASIIGSFFVSGMLLMSF